MLQKMGAPTTKKHWAGRNKKKGDPVKVIEFKKNKPMRIADALESSLLSAMMQSDWLTDELKQTVIALSENDDLNVYLHGGMATHIHIKQNPLAEKVIFRLNMEDMLNDFKTSDVDVIVRPTETGLNNCSSSLSACIKQNHAMERVADELKLLRERIYKILGQGSNFTDLLNRFKEVAQDAEIVEMPHRTILNGKMVERLKKRKIGRVCHEADYLEGKGCSALADSYNLSLNIENTFADNTTLNHSFVLARLAIGVRTGGKIIRVNFFDVSVPKEDDYTYTVSSAPSIAKYGTDFPVPNIAYILDSTMVQARSLANSDISDENPIKAKLAKLKNRVKLLELLQITMDEENNNSQLSETAVVQNIVNRLKSKEDRERSLKGMLNVVYDRVNSDAIYEIATFLDDMCVEDWNEIFAKLQQSNASKRALIAQTQTQTRALPTVFTPKPVPKLNYNSPFASRFGVFR